MAGRWRTLRKMRAKTNHFKPVLEMGVAPLARGLTAASGLGCAKMILAKSR